ncbi:myb dna-binding domain protein [Ophiostoma piceae UAMH 11346]|uniref:Myb dna-binding domain protein n=1 Tax=Ophiostoma piceae (strain UAMH 11346) TaxID=1262450 RepID=S3CJ52_OPHP1|nr:myb dna-binding domain protein [Ophiostoma piceae UAMH 11346]
MSPMQTPPPYTNPSSPWFSPQHAYAHPQMNARRNDPMDFRYGQQPPQPGQPHHPGQGQPPMNVGPPHGQHPQQQHPQQHPQAPQQQQQPPHPVSQQQPAPGAPPVAPTSVAQRQRKRPNPATAQPTTSASPIIPPPIPTSTPVTSNTAIPPPGTPGAPSTSAPTPTSAVTPNVAVKNLPSDEAGANPTPPPAKKSRTNTPWTPAEEHRLKQMRDAGNSWAEIAKTFPTRTEGSVKKHWYKDMHYAEFAEDESAALLNAIKEYENQKWKVIGQKVGKPAKACEQYAKEHFSDQILATPGKR